MKTELFAAEAKNSNLPANTSIIGSNSTVGQKPTAEPSRSDNDMSEQSNSIDETDYALDKDIARVLCQSYSDLQYWPQRFIGVFTVLSNLTEIVEKLSNRTALRIIIQQMSLLNAIRSKANSNIIESRINDLNKLTDLLCSLIVELNSPDFTLSRNVKSNITRIKNICKKLERAYEILIQTISDRYDEERRTLLKKLNCVFPHTT